MLKTAAQIARELGVAYRRVERAIERANVKSVQRVGIIRLFDEDAMQKIRRAIVNARFNPAARGLMGSRGKSRVQHVCK